MLDEAIMTALQAHDYEQVQALAKQREMLSEEEAMEVIKSVVRVIS